MTLPSFSPDVIRKSKDLGPWYLIQEYGYYVIESQSHSMSCLTDTTNAFFHHIADIASATLLVDNSDFDPAIPYPDQLAQEFPSAVILAKLDSLEDFPYLPTTHPELFI